MLMANGYTKTVFQVNHHYTDLDIPSLALPRDYAGMDFTTNLKRFRERAGLKQDALAERVGVAQATVQRWESGNREPKHSDLEKLAIALGVTVAQLFGGDVGGEAPEDAEPAAKVPIIGSVQAGNWREAVQQSTGFVEVPRTDAPKNSFALRVSGDSMDLHVMDGAMVVVDPSDTALYPGRLYVVINEDGETTFKQYLDNPARLVPCSSNPEHRDIPLGEGGFKVVGRVVTSTRRH